MLSQVAKQNSENELFTELGALIQESLSLLIDKPIIVKVNGVHNMDVTEVIEKYSRNEPIVVTTVKYSSNSRDLGYLVLLLDVFSAKELVKILAGKVDLELNDENALDILKEFGNIVSGAISIILSREMNGRVDYTLPEVIIDIDVAIMESIVSIIAYEYGPSIQVLDVDITSEEDQGINLKILMLGIAL